MRLADKVAIITGAGSGIGRASAHLFAREGAKVAVADINDAGGEETAAAIKSEGGDAIFVHADVSKAADMANLVKTTKEKFGKLNIFFNNAGAFLSELCETLDEARWDHVYAVDVKSIFLSVKYAVPEMRKAGGGAIVNTASNSVNNPTPGMGCYISAKGAVIALTRVLAVELAPDNIRVNCVSPSLTDTGILANIKTNADMNEWLNTQLSRVPLGQRLIRPEEIAHAALYLASDEASMTSGTNLIVDGGSGL